MLSDSDFLFLFLFLRSVRGWASSSTRTFWKKRGWAASEPSGKNLRRSYVIGSSRQPCKLVLAVGQDGTEYDLPVHEVTEYFARFVWWELEATTRGKG